MTIVLSIATSRFITMTVDSAITYSFSDRTEYGTDTKAFLFPQIGVIATWGERAGNTYHANQYIHRQLQGGSEDDLVKLTWQFLTEEYKPKEYELGEVGYHVAGFDNAGHPRLFHVFYAFDRPRRPEQLEPEYKYCDHSPAASMISYLYNGRNDLAERIIHVFLNEYMQGRDLRFNLVRNEDQVLFADFVARFAGEITPQVGPPFTTFLINPDRQIEHVTNRSFSPLDRETVQQALDRLGVIPTEE